MNPTNWYRLRRLALFGFIGIVIWLAWSRLGGALNAQEDISKVVSAAQPASNMTLAERQEVLKERLLVLERQVQWHREELTRSQTLVVLLASLGVLYSLVQGFFAHKVVENFSTQADKTVQSAKDELKTQIEGQKAEIRDKKEALLDDVKKFRESIIKELPSLAGLSDRISRQSEEIETSISKVDIFRNHFDILSKDEVAGIEYQELFLPVFEALHPPDGEGMLRIFVGMSVFYMAKAKALRLRELQASSTLLINNSNLQSSADSIVNLSGASSAITPGVSPYASEHSMAVSRHYLQRAKRLEPHNYLVLNEQAHRVMNDVDGFLTGVKLEQAERIKTAKALLEKSYQTRPNQRRALHGLAWIDDENGNLDASIEKLRLALKINPDGEVDNQQNREAAILHNLACSLCKKAAKENGNEREELLKAAFEELKKSINPAVPDRLYHLKADLGGGGDLVLLAQHPEYGQECNYFVSKLTKVRPSGPR